MQDNKSFNINVKNHLKELSQAEIINWCKDNSQSFSVCMINLTHDFNFGSLVRNANAFGAHHIYYLGSRRWDRRGAVGTHNYKYMTHFENLAQLKGAISHLRNTGEIDSVVAIENGVESTSINTHAWSKAPLMLFGSETNGLSEEYLDLADNVLHIPDYGSVPSINVAAASAVAMNSYSSFKERNQ